MLSSAPDIAEGEPVLQIFDRWPKDWDGAFTLLARGGFEVSSAIHGGKVAFVEIHSLAGSDCAFKAPWGQSEMVLFRDGKKAESVAPDAAGLLKFKTRRNEQIILVPPGVTPARIKILANK